MKQNKENKKYYLSAVVEDVNGNEIERRVQVSKEVYSEYMKSVWNEEKTWYREKYYQETKAEKNLPDEKRFAFDRNTLPKVLSLDSIVEGGGEEKLPFQPDFSNGWIDEGDKQALITIVREVLSGLKEAEKVLYQHLFVEGMSEREFERKFFVPRKTVTYRKQRLLKKIEIEILKKYKKSE